MKKKLLFVFLLHSIVAFAQQDSLKAPADTLKQSVVLLNKMPEFPGGEEAMYKFILDNLRYPKAAKEQGITGKVFVDFMVEKDGSVQHVEVRKSVDSLLDAEAVRVVSLLPGFKPGESLGKPVRVKMTLPIIFELSPANATVQKSPAVKKRNLIITGFIFLAALTVILVSR
ncbi:MAG: energy transducer TonB [Bacteroidia bacterium]|nr:energy transducer TonB [Bacteroidia bacterium]